MTVIFNDDIYPVSNFTQKEHFNDTMLRFKIRPGDSESPNPLALLGFNWTCTQFTERQMKFSLTFENPKAVSDQVEIYMRF